MKANKLLILIAAILIAQIYLASALTISSVSSNPTEIQPGEKVSLDLTIDNNLDNDATDVTVSLDLKDVPFAPYQSSSDANFDEVREDKSKNAGFNLIASSDAASGTYKIPVKISYTIGGVEKTGSGLISLIVVADAKLDLSVDNSVLIKGKNADLSLKITNSGLGEARLLNVKILQASGIKIIGSDSVYLGNIDSDDFDSADFKVSISENAGSIISLPVKINYRDSRNKEVEESKTLTLTVYTEKQALQLGLIQKSNTLSIILGIVVIIVLYLIYRRIKKARKKKKLEQEG